jgi:transposase
MPDLEPLSRDELIALLVGLYARVEELSAENAELRAALEAKGGGNPGGPRTTPKWVKPNRPVRDDAEGPKPRKKRAENRARKLSEPTETVIHRLDRCPDCGHKLPGGTLHRVREVIDLPAPHHIVRHHLIYRVRCGVCGRDCVAQPDLSDEVVGRHRVGRRAMSVVASLRTQCRVPLRTIQQVLAGLYGLKLSQGELSGLLADVADRGQKTYEAYREEMRSSAVVHADETGWREDGRNGYVWSFSTDHTRWFVRDPSRSSAVPLAILGGGPRRAVVCDFYAGYGPLPGVKQRCWVHLLRHLKELEESHPGDVAVAQWRAQIRDLYGRAKAYQEEHAAMELPIPMRVLNDRPRVRRQFERALMKLARPHLGRKRDPCRVLAERIRKFLQELFVFVEHPEVPSENNAAEQAIRPLATARKVFGGTRSPRGSKTLAILQTLFGTWSLRGLDPLEACMAMLASS